MHGLDALVMGHTTFETVCGFDIDWPYTKPVFVLSNSLDEIPNDYAVKAFLAKGELTDILANIHSKEHHHLYIDGGTTIQGFLKEDLIDTMIITTIPVILGRASPLFSCIDSHLWFECTENRLFHGKIAQNHYKRTRNEKKARH